MERSHLAGVAVLGAAGVAAYASLTCLLKRRKEEQKKLKPGKGVFSFPYLPGRSDMRVFYYLPPEGYDPNTEPLFVLHGLKRDAEDYFNSVMDTGEPERLKVFLMCPEFSKPLFPEVNGYNFGSVFKENPEHYEPEDHDGELLPEIRPPREWAFTCLEECFTEALARSSCKSKTYKLFGHSAGAQFVHRFALIYAVAVSAGLLPAWRVSEIISGNSGWYTVPHFPPKDRFPYGLKALDVRIPFAKTGAAAEEEITKAYVQAPLTLLLGEEDTDPHKPNPKVWRHSPESIAAQGPHRFGRGHNFLKAAQDSAKQLGVPCNWEVKTVPGVGHDGGRMSTVALSMLYDPALGGKVDINVLTKVKGAAMA